MFDPIFCEQNVDGLGKSTKNYSNSTGKQQGKLMWNFTKHAYLQSTRYLNYKVLFQYKFVSYLYVYFLNTFSEFYAENVLAGNTASGVRR